MRIKIWIEGNKKYKEKKELLKRCKEGKRNKRNEDDDLWIFFLLDIINTHSRHDA